MNMHRVLDGIHCWSVFNEIKQLDFNGHHLAAGGEVLLIDPPPLTDAQATQIEALGTPTKIVLTNKDHRRAAPEAKARFGAEVWVPALDADLLDCPFDATYGDGDTFCGGALRALHLPGLKSPGETALHWPERRLAFLGDALLGKPPGALCLLPPAKIPDVEAAKAGLRRLLSLDLETILVGDCASILEDAAAALRAFFEASPTR